MNDLHEQLRGIFSELFHVEVADNATDLIESGILDSAAFVDLLLQLEHRYGVRLNIDELELDYFRSINSIAALIAGLNPPGTAKPVHGVGASNADRQSPLPAYKASR
jgi:acyl carrier protein